MRKPALGITSNDSRKARRHVLSDEPTSLPTEPGTEAATAFHGGQIHRRGLWRDRGVLWTRPCDCTNRHGVDWALHGVCAFVHPVYSGLDCDSPGVLTRKRFLTMLECYTHLVLYRAVYLAYGRCSRCRKLKRRYRTAD